MEGAASGVSVVDEQGFDPLKVGVTGLHGGVDFRMC